MRCRDTSHDAHLVVPHGELEEAEGHGEPRVAEKPRAGTPATEERCVPQFVAGEDHECQSVGALGTPAAIVGGSDFGEGSAVLRASSCQLHVSEYV